MSAYPTTPDEQAILEMAATNLADQWECERDLAEQDPEFVLTPHAEWTPDAMLDDVQSNQAACYYEDGIRTSDDAYGLAYCLTLLEHRALIECFWNVVWARAKAIYADMQPTAFEILGLPVERVEVDE